MGKPGIQRAPIGPYAPPRGRIRLGLAKGGLLAALPRIIAHCVRGRVLAGKKQLEQATEAFEAAVKEAQTAGWRLLELFALRDLKLSVLDKNGQGDVGSARIGKVLKMLKGQGCVCGCASTFAPAWH